MMETLFGKTQRLQMTESIELTAQSLNAYGPSHDVWVFAWSGGKDSTCTLTLCLWLIESGKVKRPSKIIVCYADTRQEIIPLSVAAYQIIDELMEIGIDVEIVMADLDDRFLVYMLGKGVPPPSNTFRWCTGKIKVEPMSKRIAGLTTEYKSILVITGVRMGESAVRDERIKVSCTKDGGECGQGWYQSDLQGNGVYTLAPILHWRVCHVWEWLKHWAPLAQYGDWSTAIIADAYGGDEAEEINARTGCMGCPLASEDKALKAVCKMPKWAYLSPLLELKAIYREMKLKQFRLRKPGGEKRKDGKFSKNQNRLGPLTIQSREYFLNKIIAIQDRVNAEAERLNRPKVDILNSTEIARIRELMAANTWPNKWTGSEPTGDVMLADYFQDGSIQEKLFYLNN